MTNISDAEFDHFIEIVPSYRLGPLDPTEIHIDVHGASSFGWFNGQEVADAVAAAGFRPSTDEPVSHPQSLDEMLEAAWESAEADIPRKGDRVIARSEVHGSTEFGVWTTPVDRAYPSADVRILERATATHPEWLDAKVIRADFEGERVILVRDDDDDWLIAEGNAEGNYVMSHGAQGELSDVEILVAS